jgi:hypothetical protein
MADDEKARLARKGLDLVDAADPKKIKSRIQESAKDAAAEVVSQGVELFEDLTGNDDERRPPSPTNVNIAEALGAMDARTLESFDQRLRAAEADTTQQDRSALRKDLANVRRSFPEESKELAVLVFSCVDLLRDLQASAAGAKELAPEDLVRREALLTRIAALLSPNAGKALTSFVDHVVQLSRRTRGA